MPDRLPSLLIAAPLPEFAEALAVRLQSPSWAIAGTTACCNLVRDAVRVAPQAVVVEAGAIDAALLETLAPLQAARPLPLLLFGPAGSGAALDLATAAAEAGVRHWSPSPCDAAALALALPLACRIFQREQALQQQVAAAQARLDERKWVDRAKGMLMASQHLSEPDAFALLRTASMQTNLRVGEVSRAVVEAAEAAEAVNLAGQLRMLSQRIVKTLVLTQMGAERAAAEDAQHDSITRVQAVIDHLEGLEPSDELRTLRTATVDAWRALQQALRAGGPSADPLLIDQGAARLLQAAQQLTDGLQSWCGRRSLQIVNLCGRQRMLSQRVAKEALLAGWLPEQAGRAAAAAAVESVAEFESALGQLERSPLAGGEIRSTLAVARGQWQRMLEGMRNAGTREGRLLLARESEALLQSFERLTSLYEHSMQVLLG